MTDTAVNDDPGPIRRGRDARAAKRRNRVHTWLPELERKIPWVDLLTEEQVRTIHEASMDVIEEVGVEFRCEDAIAMWKATGASVDGVRVRIDRELLMELVGTAPSSYTLILEFSPSFQDRTCAADFESKIDCTSAETGPNRP